MSQHTAAAPDAAPPRPRARPWRTGALLAVLAGALHLLVLGALADAPRRAVLAVDDLTQLAAAATACVACVRAAARRSGTRRRAWLLVAAGTGSWTAGQALWSWQEVARGRELPFPSPSDAGFLAFPLLTAAGLLLWLHSGSAARERVRDVLDGALIAGALLMLSWAACLDTVLGAGGPLLPLALSTAYPVGDVVLATLVLLALSRSTAQSRGPLLQLAAGLGSLAVADSLYVYLGSTGSYATGSATSAGWVSGFLLVASAAGTARRLPACLPLREPGDPALQAGWLRLALPYLPVVGAEAVLVDRLVEDAAAAPLWMVLLGLVLVVLMLVRQALVLLDHRALVERLRAREAELQRLAFHDPLTGAANRALFLDRVERLVEQHRRDGGGGAVLFVDLDGFKRVNDTLGHAAGDAVLVEVAARLRTQVRAVDTVARLGGDEFAVVLAAGSCPAVVTGRLAAALVPPLRVDGRDVPLAASVGACDLADVPDEGPAAAVAEALVRAADRSMYAVKARRRAGLAERWG
ncbi:GGDEF domain-containing protein [Vallicoccus soli]|uniref:GGDEF domain-containing protein n=1 Tax=Vallicoccus soli TaxID=2339232 RepID=A0A3A3YRX6_9ACTN|nr:GGDEF domain-containing protein [Vallicoccus soli]RJK93396.1 GGDEF domain-containing protein [Vallicoccus soli]